MEVTFDENRKYLPILILCSSRLLGLEEGTLESMLYRLTLGKQQAETLLMICIP